MRCRLSVRWFRSRIPHPQTTAGSNGSNSFPVRRKGEKRDRFVVCGKGRSSLCGRSSQDLNQPIRIAGRDPAATRRERHRMRRGPQLPHLYPARLQLPDVDIAFVLDSVSGSGDKPSIAGKYRTADIVIVIDLSRDLLSGLPVGDADGLPPAAALPAAIPPGVAPYTTTSAVVTFAAHIASPPPPASAVRRVISSSSTPRTSSYWLRSNSDTPHKSARPKGVTVAGTALVRRVPWPCPTPYPQSPPE